MFLIDAEHDGLLEAISAFLQKIRDFLGDQFRAVVDDEGAIKVLRVIDPVFDFVTVAVGVSPLRPITVHVHVDMDLDNFVRRQEAVLNALLEGVGINGLPEVIDVRNIFRFLGRGGEPDLGCAGEVFEYFPPGCVFGRAAAVALVDNNQIEKSR